MIERWMKGQWQDELCGERPLRLHHVYRGLRKLGVGWSQIERVVRERAMWLFKEEAQLLICDFTTIHWDSEMEDALRRKGWNKQGLKDCVQVLVGVVITGNGLPVGAVILPGNTSEKEGVLKLVQKLKEGFQLRGVVWVGDRGLWSTSLREALEQEGVELIEKVPRSVLTRQEERLVEEDSGWEVVYWDEESGEVKAEYKELRRDGESRLIAVRWSDRQQAEVRKIEELKKQLCKQLECGVDPTRSWLMRRWKGLLKLEKGQWQIDEARIERLKRWAGVELYYASNSSRSVRSLLATYRKSWRVEALWRILKSGIRTHPMWLWNKQAVQGHIFCGLLAGLIARIFEVRCAMAGLPLSWQKIVQVLQEMRLVQVKTSFEMLLQARGRKPDWWKDLPVRVWLRQRLTSQATQILEALNVSPLPVLMKIETLGNGQRQTRPTSQTTIEAILHGNLPDSPQQTL